MLFGDTTAADCFSNFGLRPPFQLEGMKTVLGTLYQLPDTLASISAVQEAAKKKCKDNDADLAAIKLAGSMVPAGMGLLGVSLVISVVNLAMLSGSDKAKMVGIAAGLVALLGMILIIGGFGAVLLAPLYSSLGGDPVDNNISFASGSAFSLALALIGGSVVGALLLLAGGCLTKPADESAAILKP